MLKGARTDAAKELLGTCSGTNYIYPEMWGTNVTNISALHAHGAPPKPKSFDEFAKLIAASMTSTTSNSSANHGSTLAGRARDRACHLHLPMEQLHPALANDIVLPQGSRPPSATAANPASVNVWVTGGTVQSGLHFDSHYNSLTVLQGRKRVVLFPPTQTKYLYKVKANEPDLLQPQTNPQ
jgi:hypothetical protein